MSKFARKAVMIEPVNFAYNSETAQDNAFMSNYETDRHQKCVDEFHVYKETLESYGIPVKYWKNFDEKAPDSVFCNNWFGTFDVPDVNQATLVLYPMKYQSRQRERRTEYVEELTKDYPNIIDLTHYESQGLSLEGTGSLVIDRKDRIIFMSISQRSSETVLNDLISQLNLLTDRP